MPDQVPIRRALISVSDKSDIVPFARSLAAMGVELISTGGTANQLREAGIDTIPVEEITGIPEMMNGRVKTLHPRIHGGLLARRDNPDHVASMNDHDIPAFDLVCINLYPFERTIANPEVDETEAIEQIDIGGPAMLRSAAKNHDFVLAVTSPDQYDAVIAEMQEHDGCTSMHLRRDCAASAFARTAGYDAAISNWLSRTSKDALPPRLHVSATRVTPLRYGENPHQTAALYALPGTGESGIASATTLDGKPLSYNNILDAAAAFGACRDLARACETPVAVVIKHATPCGAGTGATAEEAFEAAWSGDPLAAFGGIVGISTPVDTSLANTIAEGKRFIEVIMAPSIAPDAADILSERWPSIRLLATPDLHNPASASTSVRHVPGGLLAQSPDTAIAKPNAWKHAAGPPAEPWMYNAGVIAWTVAKHAASNAIAVAGSHRLFGVGCGQVDRLSAAKLAVSKSESALKHHPGVAASDAFFPFADGPECLIEAGIKCVIHPGGSKRDQDTLTVCENAGVTCLLTGSRHFRH